MNTDKDFFVDPVSGSVYSYAQFVADVGNPIRVDLPGAYATICEMVSCLVSGADYCVQDGLVPKFEMEGGGVSEPGTSARPFTADWLQAIRNSTSKICLKTSGTTGQPKQIVHSVQSLTRGLQTGTSHENDVWGLAYPIDRLAGLQVLLQALLNQNTIVQLHGLPAETVHEAIEKYDVTHISCTPTFVKMLAAENRAHPEMQRLTTGGERCDAATLAAIGKLFPNARHRNIYALTEVGNLLITDGDRFVVPAELQENVSVIDGGLAIHRSLLADASMTETRNPKPDPRYPIPDTRNPDWFQTGDLVEVLNDAPLTFRFLDRRDDVINVGGFKVLPQQVEEQLLKLPMIRQAVAYGKKNSVTGQIVVCDVVIESGHELDTEIVKQKLGHVLPRHAVPRMINVVESMRLTSTGKIWRPRETS